MFELSVGGTFRTVDDDRERALPRLEVSRNRKNASPKSSSRVFLKYFLSHLWLDQGKPRCFALFISVPRLRHERKLTAELSGKGLGRGQAGRQEGLIDVTGGSLLFFRFSRQMPRKALEGSRNRKNARPKVVIVLLRKTVHNEG